MQQINRAFLEYQKKWVYDVCLSTDDFDSDRMKVGIEFLYTEYLSSKEPQIEICESPFECLLAGMFYDSIKNPKRTANFGGALLIALNNTFGYDLHCSHILRYAMKYLAENINDTLGKYKQKQHLQTIKLENEEIKLIARKSISGFFPKWSFLSDLLNAHFFYDINGENNTNQISSNLIYLSKNLHYYVAFHEIFFFSRNPIKIKLNQFLELDHSNGPAIKWSDGKTLKV